MCVCVCVCVCVCGVPVCARARPHASFALSCVSLWLMCEEYIFVVVVELSRQFLLTFVKPARCARPRPPPVAGDRDTAVAE